MYYTPKTLPASVPWLTVLCCKVCLYLHKKQLIPRDTSKPYQPRALETNNMIHWNTARKFGAKFLLFLPNFEMNGCKKRALSSPFCCCFVFASSIFLIGLMQVYLRKHSHYFTTNVWPAELNDAEKKTEKRSIFSQTFCCQVLKMARCNLIMSPRY